MPDFTDPKQNDLIPGGPQVSEEELAGGDLVPEHMRTLQESGYILAKLETTDSALVDGVVINRAHLNRPGDTGGEEFLIEADGLQKRVSLSQLAAIRTSSELKDLLTETE